MKRLFILLLLPFIFAACGERPPRADFGPYELSGTPTLQQNDVAVFRFIQFFTARPADCYNPEDIGTVYCDIFPDGEIDQITVTYSTSLGQGPSTASTVLQTLNADNREFYFLFSPPLPGTYEINVNTRVELSDEGISSDDDKTQKILLQVQAASSPSVSIAKTFNTLPTLTSHVSPPLFKKMLNGNNTTYPAVELLNGMTQDANLYLQNDRLLIFFNNTNYTTPFTAPKEGFIWAAVGQESGDSFESVYVMISNSFGTPIQYYKLVLNP